MYEQPTGLDEAEGSSLPWQARERYPGPVQALWETVKAVLFRPSAAFAHIETYGSAGSSMLYVVLLGTLGGLIGAGWQWLARATGLFDMWFAIGGQGAPEAAQMPFSGVMMGAQVVVFAVLIPVMMVFVPIINAAILHVLLWMIGGANASFEGTYAVVAYGTGSTALLHIIPFCGGLVGGIWNLVIQVIAVREVHETTTAKALIAVLLPVVLCCGFMAVMGILGAYAAIIAAGAMAAGA
ncbi:MAG: YIP1 family protein [Candidatus Brocadiia bacterium]